MGSAWHWLHSHRSLVTSPSHYQTDTSARRVFSVNRTLQTEESRILVDERVEYWSVGLSSWYLVLADWWPVRWRCVTQCWLLPTGGCHSYIVTSRPQTSHKSLSHLLTTHSSLHDSVWPIVQLSPHHGLHLPESHHRLQPRLQDHQGDTHGDTGLWYVKPFRHNPLISRS